MDGLVVRKQCSVRIVSYDDELGVGVPNASGSYREPQIFPFLFHIVVCLNLLDSTQVSDIGDILGEGGVAAR